MSGDQTPRRDSGSFRDPSGYVFLKGDEAIRSINPLAQKDFQRVIDSGVLTQLAQAGLLIDTQVVNASPAELEAFRGPRGEQPSLLLRHPRIPFISYPYEWTFGQLQDAALAHLSLHLQALDAGMTLSDATPFNMQFFEGRVMHMDVLSLKPYVDGEHWAGYHQFCRTFLLPLLIEAWCGVPFQPMLRGRIDGISLQDAVRLLPRRKLWTSLNGMIHVAAQSRLVAAANATSSVSGQAKAASLPRARFRSLLQELHNWISGLRSGRKTSYWTDYAQVNTYTQQMRQVKLDFIARWASTAIPGGTVWDIGGNTGDYSQAALKAGASLAVVFDSDLDSLEKAHVRRKQGLNLLPLLIDLADPSPSQGWNQAERKGLNERTRPDGIMALAVIHHLVIGRNLPLQEVVDWFVRTAPNGIIEFVPKSDPMVVELLMHRQDVFIDYDEAHFLACLAQRAQVTGQHRFSENGRLMVSYQRRA